MKLQILISFIVLLVLQDKRVRADSPNEENEYSVVFIPQNLTKIPSGSSHLVEWYTTVPGAKYASYNVQDPSVAAVEDFETNFSTTGSKGNFTGKGRLTVAATFIGFDVINLTVYNQHNETLGAASLKVSVLLTYQKLNTIFTYILSVLVVILYVNMGATIDLTVVRGIAKKPIGPLIGIICQYGIMPVLAFGLSKFIFPTDIIRQLGMFLTGTSPSGGGSNMWTLLLGGSLDLSIMMTFSSMIVAFGAVPLWVMTLGPKIIGKDSEFAIPYSSIASVVTSLVIPCVVGLLIQKYLPKVAIFLERRILVPFSIFNIIFIFTVGAYANRYIFSLLSLKVILAGFALPFLGYASGFLLAFLARRPWKEIIAISIETGMQNTNITIIILKFTLGRPAGDLAIVMPACNTLMTPLPLLVAVIIKKTYARFVHSDAKDITPQVPKSTAKGGSVNRPSLIATRRKQTSTANGEIGHQMKDASGIDNPALI